MAVYVKLKYFFIELTINSQTTDPYSLPLMSPVVSLDTLWSNQQMLYNKDETFKLRFLSCQLSFWQLRFASKYNPLYFEAKNP